MPYPHYDAEFGCAILLIACFAAIAFPLAQRLDPRIGIWLASLPLLALIAVCVIFYRRARGK